MAKGIRTSASQLKRKVSKDEIEARSQAEAEIVTNDTKPLMNEVVSKNKRMKRLFNELSTYSENFTEADSIPLNTLAFNLSLKGLHEYKLSKMNPLDDNYERFLLRIEKFNKQINESMKQLCIPLSQRFRLANDLAKVMIEEKKLQQMNDNNATTQVNPLLAVLEATKE